MYACNNKKRILFFFRFSSQTNNTQHTTPQHTMPSKKQRTKAAKRTKLSKALQQATHHATVRTIRDKWHEQTSTALGGHFIRFLDGNRGNCRVENLSLCTPHMAFSNPDWIVDWDANLTNDEIDFVRTNMSNFQALYAPADD